MKTERFSLLLVIRRAIGSAYDKTELWVCAKGFALMLAIFLCLPKRQRMSHNNGIAAAIGDEELIRAVVARVVREMFL